MAPGAPADAEARIDAATGAHRDVLLGIAVGLLPVAIGKVGAYTDLDLGDVYLKLFELVVITAILASWIVVAESSRRLARAVSGSRLWIGAFVPGFIGWIFGALVLWDASMVLRCWGVPVGLLGPKRGAARASRRS